MASGERSEAPPVDGEDARCFCVVVVLLFSWPQQQEPPQHPAWRIGERSEAPPVDGENARCCCVVVLLFSWPQQQEDFFCGNRLRLLRLKPPHGGRHHRSCTPQGERRAERSPPPQQETAAAGSSSLFFFLCCCFCGCRLRQQRRGQNPPL